MAVKPPKCRTCGKEEWTHLCRGVLRKTIPLADGSTATFKALLYPVKVGKIGQRRKAKKNPKRTHR